MNCFSLSIFDLDCCRFESKRGSSKEIKDRGRKSREETQSRKGRGKEG